LADKAYYPAEITENLENFRAQEDEFIIRTKRAKGLN